MDFYYFASERVYEEFLGKGFVLVDCWLAFSHYSCLYTLFTLIFIETKLSQILLRIEITLVLIKKRHEETLFRLVSFRVLNSVVELPEFGADKRSCFRYEFVFAQVDDRLVSVELVFYLFFATLRIHTEFGNRVLHINKPIHSKGIA